MASADKKIPKLRTFADDLARAQAAQQPPEAPQKPPTQAPDPEPKPITPVKNTDSQPPAPPEEVAPVTHPPVVEPTPVAAAPTSSVPTQEVAPANIPASKPTVPINPPFSSIQQQQSPQITVTRKGAKKIGPIATEQTNITENLQKVSGGNSVKRSVLTDELHDVIGEAEGAVGTVITDTKHKRFKLLPAIKDSVQGWVSEKQGAYELAQQPKHTVSDTETRRSIIESAAKESALTSKDDYDDLVNRLQQRQRTASVTPVQIIDKAAVPEPSWSHLVDEQPADTVPSAESASESNPAETTEQTLVAKPISYEELTGKIKAVTPERIPEPAATVAPPQPEPSTPVPPVVPEPDIALAPVKEISVSSTPPTPAAAPAETAVLPESQIVPPTTPVATETPEPVPQQPEREVTPTTSITTPTWQPTTPEPEAAVEAAVPESGYAREQVAEPTPEPPLVEIEAEPKPPPPPAASPAVYTAPETYQEPEPLPQPAPTYRTPTTNKSWIPGLVVASFIALLLGAGSTLWWFGMLLPAAPDTVTVTAPNHFERSAQIAIPFTPNRQITLERLTERAERTNAMTQFYFSETIAGEEVVKSSQETLDAFAFQAAAALVRTTSEFSMGASATGEPFLVFKINSFDAGFAGLLNWEPTMSADLTPLFGPVVLQTFDPNARTTNQLTQPRFVDRLVNNRDARVLVDAQQIERISYAFINPRTVIITTNIATLTELIPLVR